MQRIKVFRPTSKGSEIVRPKIGLALGSGGAKGFAHLGIIKVLEEEEIPIDMIAGSSMGALVATFYGAGKDVHRCVKMAKMFKRKYYIDYTLPKMGFIAGNRVVELIRLFTYGKKLEELDIPVNVVATDIETGEKVIFKEGSIGDAVRASIAIPGIFVPYRYQGRLLVDGGVVDRIPVSVVKEMGADLILAVDVSPLPPREKITTIYDVIMQSIEILQRELVQQRELSSHLLMQPDVSHFSSRAFTNIEEIILAGEVEAKKHVATIKKMIIDWKEQQEIE
ncbi:MAG: patatin-like phospholipase family protein [Bacillaceae bacterium]